MCMSNLNTNFSKTLLNIFVLQYTCWFFVGLHHLNQIKKKLTHLFVVTSHLSYFTNLTLLMFKYLAKLS